MLIDVTNNVGFYIKRVEITIDRDEDRKKLKE